jgi:hypothetical protein
MDWPRNLKMSEEVLFTGKRSPAQGARENRPNRPPRKDSTPNCG